MSCGKSMYGRAYGWERQSWKDDPQPFPGPNRPTDYQPGRFQKRQQHPLTATGNSTEPDHQEEAVCHVDQAARQQDTEDGGDPDLDGLQFVDMEGNPTDGRSCDIIYDDNDLESRTRIVVDEDGRVVDMYVEDVDADMWWEGGGGGGGGGVDSGAHEAPVTTLVTSVTTLQESARPAEASPTIPETTTLTRKRVKTVVTVAPVV